MSQDTETAAAVTDLLAAIVEALDVPLPSTDTADERAHYRLLERRSFDVRATLAAVLRYPGGLDDTADIIRRDAAAQPVTYTPFEFKQDGGEA